MIRQFKLKNALGEEFSLSSASDVFVYKPKGIGFGRTMTTAHTTAGHYIFTRDILSQPSVSGEIVFTASPYSRYQEMLNFVVQAGEDLRLGYSTATDEWFYLKGRFSKIEKSERSVGGGVLRCPFTFLGASLWRKELPVSVTIKNSVTPLSYDMTYNMTYGDQSASGSYTYTANGHSDAAYELELPGAVTSPVITLTAGGETIGQVDLTGTTIASGSTLLVSTVPNEAGVWSVTSGVKTSLLSSLDLTDNNFCRFPVGEPCTITITVSGSLNIDANLRIYEYYESV